MSPTDADSRIRPASRTDIPAIVEIHNSSVDEGADLGFSSGRDFSTFADPARLSAAWQDPNRVGDEEILVAELGGLVVAYVTLEDRGAARELVNIDVARDRQGQGIGTRLVRAVEDRARAEGKVAVTLGTSRNAAGVAWSSFPWWRRLGYHVTHEEENAWTRAIGPGAREIRMRKDLTPTGRVELREVEAGDLPVFFEHQQDPIAVRMAAFTPKDPSDREAFQAHWARILADPTITMKTVLLDGRVVGHVGSFVDRDVGLREVTYWIGREDWGRGLATLALSEFLRQVQTRPIYARAAADNVASIRVLEKCGFRPAGRSRAFAHARKAETDEVLLRLEAPPTETTA